MFVRWSNLSIEHEEQRRLPGYRDEAVVRRFDAPEALETRFYEVRARSVLNRVPEKSRMPFRWTVNPFRGCSHACKYCLGPDTQVLMADGLTLRIADLRVGDRIFGTEVSADGRRLCSTQVLDWWSTDKPAYEVVLADGTKILASVDHRFLTQEGWEYVAGGEPELPGRACLTGASVLLGLSPAGNPGSWKNGSLVEARAERRIVSVRSTDTTMRLFDITTGTGDFIANGVVSHNCFARPTHKFLDFDAGRDFEKEIVVKVNAPEVLRTELAKRTWKREHVALGTNTDPYQWVEGRYRLMEGIWEALRDAANPCSILTKSPLLLRDLSLMLQIAERTSFSASLSIPTLDEKAWRETEPHTPNPKARLEAVAELNRAGIPTGVLIAPLMPGINDSPEQVDELLQRVTEAGATSVGGIALHLRGEVRDVFMGWLRSQRPDLVPRYEQLYRRGAYAPVEERRRLARLVRRSEWPSSFRLRDETTPERQADRQPVRAGGHQESLF